MGVKGLFSYIRKEKANFRPTKLRNSFIILDGCNITNNLYLQSSLYTQYNGEYLGFDIFVEEFLLDLKKCNLEPIFVFDGLHELTKSNTILGRHSDRIHRLYNLQQNNLLDPKRDGTSSDFRVAIQPMLSYMTVLRTLERCGARYVVVDFEADQLAAALAMYLGAPLVSNDSDFFILGPYWAGKGCELIYVPMESCDFLTPHESDSGFYISAEQYIATETVTFRGLAPIQIPLFAVLSGNDYVPPGYFHVHLPGAVQQPDITSNNAEGNSSRFQHIVKWLSGFGNDIVEPVEQILSKFPISERPKASQLIYTGLAFYHVPFEKLPTYLSFLFGDNVPPSKVVQSPPVPTNVTNETYGLKALRVLADGEKNPQYLSVWPPRLLRSFRNGHSNVAACDALFAFGIVLHGAVENYRCGVCCHLCSLPIRKILVGLLFDSYPPVTYSLPGIIECNEDLSYTEHRWKGHAIVTEERVTFDRVSLGGFRNGFEFLKYHLYLPNKPPHIPKWLHGVACVLLLWTRNMRKQKLANYSVGLAVSLCAVAVQMRLLRNDAVFNVKDRSNITQQLLAIRRRNVDRGIGFEPMRFAYLHMIAQMESILINLAGLIDTIDALMPKGSGCEMELLPPQIMFPSGCLAHHIARRLANERPADRMRKATESWLPQLLDRFETEFLEEVKSKFSALVKFVDKWRASSQTVEYRRRFKEISRPLF